MADSRVSRILRQPYSRVIIPDDQGGYAAQILEFPGCFADGDSPEEAYSNLEEVAESWVEAALAQDFPIPVPFATQGYSGTISLRLPKSTHRRAAELAHRDGVSLNQFLVAAIAARVGSEDLMGAMLSRVDERLDSLASGPFLFQGVGLPVAGTLERPAPSAPSIDFSKLAGESSSHYEIVEPKEEKHA